MFKGDRLPTRRGVRASALTRLVARDAMGSDAAHHLVIHSVRMPATRDILMTEGGNPGYARERR